MLKSLFLFFALISPPVVVEPDISIPVGINFDCVLLKYSDPYDGHKLNVASTRVLERMKGGRVITYPDCFTPILIPKDRLDEAKKIFGNQMSELSPELK